ncbi:TetR/AcrR family transcriptional regulator [Paenibacillus sp. SYP-B3998]|uniref:TetR/AcrR family transcriptional regulator n=1 Tax=Paenibacillus sp. SYP-B3998 TaxID=2678564 RepID=A0A6G3ZZC4_9BACL|nr:TetR/AcrR family transcriptional regulator [Paenibacillus sp. SYP-B3998]NEW07450.1 TetR/AcrR family transcriptional regulator [Paenibacillus sp. SYP-B3998]
MQKGENTRRHIIAKSAELFNQYGYSGSSLSAITELTGIKKGGIYRHFASKDEIALEAYNYAANIVGGQLKEAITQKETASDKLLAYLRVYENVVNAPPFIGGCPLLNVAIESDDAHPVLRQRAQMGLKGTLDAMKAIISQGVQSGEFKMDLDIDALATFTLSTMEGAVMMSKLEGDNRHIRMNIESLSTYLKQACLRSPATSHP